METLDENLKLEIWFIDLAIRKAFSDHDIKIDDITWNPHRIGMTNDKFNIHAIQVTIGPWREVLYRIETRDIKNYSNGIKRENIDRRISELLQKHLDYASNRRSHGAKGVPGLHTIFQTK